MHSFSKNHYYSGKKKVLIQISWLLRKPADVGPNFFLPHDGPRFKVEYGVYSFVKKKIKKNIKYSVCAYISIFGFKSMCVRGATIYR